MTSAIYVYCVVKMAARPGLSRVPAGLPGAGRVRLLGAGPSLWVVAAEVPLAVYGPEPLEAALQNLGWVSDVAVAHDAVIEHFARRRGAVVIPMKLFTMFSSDARAVEEIRSRRRELSAVARRIAGAEEWGVRVMRSGPSRSAGPSGDTSSGARPGAAFLQAKKQVRDQARTRSAAAVAAANAAFATLSTIARDARQRSDTIAGATAPPLLDAAFLVSTGRRTRFRTAAARLAAACSDAGAELTLTGPWPAYNFVGPDER
jgi:hypothetical protein